MATAARQNPKPESLPWRLVGAVMAGTLLNPLNSSMIAVALLTLRADFHVSIATVTWLVSGFYLAGAVGMPLMGRLADRFGPRRVFTAGLLLVGLTGVLAPFAPAFGWLLVIRIVQAFGTATAYPAGLAVMRAADRSGRAPAAALGAVTVASSVSAALGPVLGGGLVALAGWQAIFLVNVPVILVGLVPARLWLPPDGAAIASAPDWFTTVRRLDLPGVLLFSGMLAAILGFLLSLASGPEWLLLPAAVLAAVLFLYRERRFDSPFLDIRLLAANHALLGVYAQFAAVNLAFYAVFFGLPLWLEDARHFAPDTTGLLLLPVASVGILITPLAARLINRRGARLSLIIGSVLLLAGALLLLPVSDTTPVPLILGIGAVLGVPNGFNNLGLQTILYEAAPPEQIGVASGLFQTARYTGAILSTALIGIIFAARGASSGLHVLALIVAVVGVLLVVGSVATRR